MSEIVHCALGYVTNHRRRQRPTNNPNKKLRSATYMAGSFCGTASIPVCMNILYNRNDFIFWQPIPLIIF